MLQYFIFIVFYISFKLLKRKKKLQINHLIEKYPEDVFIISDNNCKNKSEDDTSPKCNKCNYCQIPNLLNLESIDDMVKMLSKVGQNEPINIILHTGGGDSDAPDTLANVLNERKGLVRIHIPSYAYSSGTMIALVGDEIYMNWYSTCSPIDVQMDVSHENDLEESYSTKHIRSLKKCKPREDRQYLQGCEAEDYHQECEQLVNKILLKNDNSQEIIAELVNHSVSHSKSFTRNELEKLKLPIKRDVPAEIMDIYQQYEKLFN